MGGDGSSGKDSSCNDDAGNKNDISSDVVNGDEVVRYGVENCDYNRGDGVFPRNS